MRYFSYNEYKTEPGVDDYIETKSEEEIRHEYYPWWYEQMCKKFGKEKVDELYAFEDCLDDWMVVNWAWEVKDMYDREYAKMCVGNGWHGLIDEAYDLIEPYEIQVTQVKEKFGQLRIYTGIMTKEVSDVLDPKIWAIESRSMTVCESCGQPSTLQSRGGWLKSICNTCKDINDVLAKT